MAAPVSNNNANTANKSKRSNKPMMEKRRRERINKALNSIKEIVLKAQQQDPSKNTKLEKADILELTLKHLEDLHGSSPNISPKSEECSRKFKEGFDRCLTEIIKFLGTFKFDENSTVTNDFITAVIEHLKGISHSTSVDIRCHHGNKTESKVRAMIDTSVFSSGVMRHEQCVEDRVPSPIFNNNNNNKEVNFKTDYVHNFTGLNAPIFPPSPPDSSRSSSPPDSLRGSPKNFVDFGTIGQERLLEPLPTNRQDRHLATHLASRLDRRPFVHHRPPASIPTHRDGLHPTRPSNRQDRPHVDHSVISTFNTFSPLPAEAEGRPLNLSVTSHSTRRESSIPARQYHKGVSYSIHGASLSPSTVVVKREAFSPTSECAVPTFPSSNCAVPTFPSSNCAVPTIPSSNCAGPLSYSPNSPSGSFQALEGDRGSLTFQKMANALPLEATGGSSWSGRLSLRTEGGRPTPYPGGRPTPYPKKEAVKRYQNQNHFQNDKEAHVGGAQEAHGDGAQEAHVVEEVHGGEEAHEGEAQEAHGVEAQGGESPPLQGGINRSHWRPW